MAADQTPEQTEDRATAEVEASAALSGIQTRLEAVARIPLASVSPAQLASLITGAKMFHTVLDNGAWPKAAE